MELELSFPNSKVCRLCPSDQYLSDLYLPRNLEVRELINLFIDIEDKNETKLPTLICAVCKHIVESFIDFKDKFKARDVGLRSLVEVEEKDVITDPIEIEDFQIQIPEVEDELFLEVPKEETYPIEEFILDFPGASDNEYFEECKLPKSKTKSPRKSPAKRLRPNKKNEFACDYCTNVYATWTEMDQHKENAHLECPECLKTYNTHRIMKNHRRKRHVNPTNCEICGKHINNLWMLEKHMKSFHNEERNHKCDVCEKGFNTPSGLKIHMAAHDPVNHIFSEICDFKNCGKVYKTVNSLKVHKRTHFDW